MKSPWSIWWLVPLGWITGLLLVMLLTLILLSRPGIFVDQALRGFEDLDIVLILARGLDHLDQLGGAIDRRFPDIAVGVGERVRRVVAFRRRHFRGRDLVDLDRRAARIVRHGSEEGFEREM